MRVILTCGGTGGHIYPAISLADALKDIENADILFIGTKNHMEAKLIPQNGYDFKSIKAAGFNGNIIKKGLAFLTMLLSINEAKKIIKEFKADIVVGFGGYVSAPVIEAAYSLKVPVILHEQNAYAGKANLFLEKYSNRVVSCYKSVCKQFKNEPLLLGNPRTYAASKKQDFDIYKEYKLDKDKKIILIVMGSQGSESVNAIMKEVLYKLSDKNYQVVYVTGKNHFEEFNDKEYGNNIHILPYVNQIALLPYVNLIVTRGGATTASEIGVFKTPSIIIPSPYVPNNHQELNALALVEIKAAILKREKELDIDELADIIDNLINDDKKLAQMSENAAKIGFANAAIDMINLMKEYVRK